MLWYPYRAADAKRLKSMLKLLYRSPLAKLLGN
jgi:hypothetical protein